MAASSRPSPFRPSCLKSRPPNETTNPLEDGDDYKMMVLRFSHDTTEEEVDQQLLQTALDLSINVPQDPKTTLELATGNVSALDLNSAPSEHHPPPSRTSDSTHPTSCSSSEQRGHTKTSSLTSASIISAPSSVDSFSSQKPPYTKIKEGIRRFSTMRRRKTMDAQVPPIPIAAITALRPAPRHRSATIDRFPPVSISRRPVPPSTPVLSPEPLVRIPSGAPELQEDDSKARHRSIHHPRLKRLRWSQLEEQRRFIRFEADQHRLMGSRQLDIERRILDEHPQRLKALQDQHAEVLLSLEHRHLSAEVDLERTLEVERQACETRLKHMQAYCNPRSIIEGMPNRIVTKQHYRQLEQQRHARDGMDNLHAARINVLREKQAKQLERIIGKQESEVEEVDLGLSRKLQDLERRCQDERELLIHEFQKRRRRLMKRWVLTEAIMRRKLENETGEAFGPLPSIEWDGRQGEEEEELVGRDLVGNARMVYDIATLNMI
ncbi:MAG: hypothetical protein Q9201_000096 [Fulgogasparrea decipioides]